VSMLMIALAVMAPVDFPSQKPAICGRADARLRPARLRMPVQAESMSLGR